MKRAEEFISKALKFNSKNEHYWETMSDILYKKQDYQGCKNCLEAALAINPRNKIYLRNLSIILRCLGSSKKFDLDDERKSNVQKSVDFSK